MGPFQVEVQTQIERTPLCSRTEITDSGRKFERTTVWTMVWSSSDQRSIWSEKSDHRRIRAHLSLIINGSGAIGSNQKCIRAHLSLIINDSSAIGSDQKYFRTQLRLIKDPFEHPIFFIFLLRDFGFAKKQQSSSVLIRDSSKVRWLSSEKRSQSPADSKDRSPSEEILINCRPRFFFWKAV